MYDGKRLKELRKSRGLTIYDVADKIEVGGSTYAGYETGHRKPPLEVLSRIARFYNVSTDYLLGLTEEKNAERVRNDASEYLKKDDLTWNGVPLTDAELKPIRDLLEVVVRDRLPKKKVMNNSINNNNIYNSDINSDIDSNSNTNSNNNSSYKHKTEAI